MYVDETLILTVDENVTTGYSWIINETNEDEFSQLVRIYDSSLDENYDDGNDEGIRGAGSKRILHYKANNEGNHTIEMAYARPWMFQGFD